MLLKNKVEIEEWLNKYKVKNYELLEDEKYGYMVNVKGSINLSNIKLKSIDVKFNEINGNFNCSNNELESLNGSPKIVNGSFYCQNNQLKSLNNCPEVVKSSFFCYSNLLKSLECCPEYVGGVFFGNNNNLKSLYFIPKEIKSNYINIKMNILLGDLEHIEDFNELKKIINIYKEKEELDLLIKNKCYNLINNKSIESTNIINVVGKINKI